MLVAALAPARGVLAEKPTGQRKLDREMRVMERTIDEMLVESPNLLVSTGALSDGVYLEEFGAVFHFDASLVTRGWGGLDWWGGHPIRIEDDGDRIVIFKGRPDLEDEDRDAPPKKDADKKGKESGREALFSRSEKLYQRGKSEIVDVLVDYGDLLASLRDDQWIAIVADFSGSEYLAEKKISQCVAKARVGDLRAHADGSISRDALLKKVVVEER
jgi:hypothetical protein